MNSEPLRLFLDLVGQLSSSGGHLEQTYAYIDPMSANHGYQLCNNEKYDAAYRRTMQFLRHSLVGFAPGDFLIIDDFARISAAYGGSRAR